MKATCLVLIVLGAAAFVQGRTFAVPPATSSQQASAATPSNTASNHPSAVGQAASVGDVKAHSNRTPADRQREGRDTTHEKDASGHSSPTKTNNVSSPTFGDAANRYQPGLTNHPGGARKGSSIQNKYAFPARAPGVVPKSTFSPSNVRHRSPNPALVGGSGNVKMSNAGTIDGTQMSRKP